MLRRGIDILVDIIDFFAIEAKAKKPSNIAFRVVRYLYERELLVKEVTRNSGRLIAFKVRFVVN